MKHKFTFFAIVLMAMTFPGRVEAYDFSATAPTGQTLYYNINGNDVTVTYPTKIYNGGMLEGSWNGYTTPTGNLTIPSTVDYGGTTYSVTAIDQRAFAQCNGLISVSIPNGIVTIGNQAFSSVNNIEYSGTASGSPWGAKTINGYLEDGFVFTNSAKTILTGYYGTSTTITIPTTVTSIGNAAFSGKASITSVNVPNSVISIGNSSFSGCIGLLSLTIPNTVSNIGSNAFGNVANVVYNGSATGSPWGAKTVNGYLENGFVFSDAAKTTLTAYSGNATVIAVPNTTITIANDAFRGCNNITSVSIPSSVTSIGDNAFYYCHNLTTVSLPNSVLTIGSRAFHYCTSLASIIIPESVVSIGSNAFDYCNNLSTVFFNAINCTSVGSSVYSSAFYRCNNISTVVFGENVQNIPNYLFYEGTSISSITINNAVTHIGICAFANCTGISSLSVPNSVTSIGYNAFAYIKNVSYSGTAPGSPWGAYCINAFFEGDFMYSDASKTVLMGYTGSDTSVTVPNTVTTIGENAFRGSNVSIISIPSSVTMIGDNAFCQSKLRNIILPNSIYSIGNGAFMQCSQLKSINIPNSVYSLGNGICSYCTSLETAYISSSITELGSESFINCTNLRYVSLPQYLQSIGNSAFSNCFKLTDLNVPISVTQIGTDAFGFVRNIIYNGSASENCYMDLCYWGARCKNGYLHDSVYYADSTMHSMMSVHPLAQNIIISESAQSVANYAFYHCDVQSITYPSSISSLGDQLYDGSTALRHIYCNATVPPSMSEWYDPLSFDYDSVTVHIPCGSLLNYTGVWHRFSRFVEATAEHTITVTSSNSEGGIAMVLLQPTCSSNEVVVIAQPNEGYFFSMWNDSVTNNPRYLILENDVNLVAIFSTTPPAPDTIHVHDTTFIPVHDTTYIDVPYAVHDTTVVIDTLTVTEYVLVHDTTYFDIHDTTYIDVPYDVHDTTYITLTDTVINTIYDTITNTVYDTITNTVYDTIDNFVYDTLTVIDTLWLTQTDTLWLHDTIIIHDTIYITQEGVDDVEAMNAKVYSSNGQVVVDGAAGNIVWFYDINGRVLATKRDEYTPLCFDAPASGTYLIKIGDHPARKVVVIR